MCVAGVIHSLRVSKRLSTQVAALIASTSASLAEAYASKAQQKKNRQICRFFYARYFCSDD
jgi:hypothetical protein